MSASAPRTYLAEALGTALLLATVVGSGIMAERLSGGNVAVALLANAIATGGVLYALIQGLGPVSGAHFNPLVTLGDAVQGQLRRVDVPRYLVAQLAGAFAGVVLAHVMFGLDPVQVSARVRSSTGELVSEVVASFGLLLVIATARRASPERVASAVALYVVGAYWFTASTAFANPAVTLARATTATFAGIRPADVAPFLVAQLVGGALGALVGRYLTPRPEAA